MYILHIYYICMYIYRDNIFLAKEREVSSKNFVELSRLPLQLYTSFTYFIILQCLIIDIYCLIKKLINLSNNSKSNKI